MGAPAAGRASLAGLMLCALAACVPELAGQLRVAQTDPAQAEAEKQAELDRQLAEAHRNLAQGLEAAGDLESAVEDYETAIALDPWPVAPGDASLEETPHGDLARICASDAAAEAVARACSRLIASGRLAPERLVVVLGHRAGALLALGETKRAMADFRTALKIDSSAPDILLARARAHERAGNAAAALADYSLALLRAPARADLRLARARLRAARGDWEGAAAGYDRVLSDPEALAAHPDAYRGRAEAHCQLGRADAAEVGWLVWADLAPAGPGYLRDLLWARGYLRGPAGPGVGPELAAALRAWTRAGCGDDRRPGDAGPAGTLG